ncbi:hypothetical protein Pan153_42990 [Gimesia panareensis]|uniref:Uncharacterized protein n=2 Tax=Gimesia panareensis TaxID=2527978 RepID=A0A518FTG6_9PLAN|nr:hypothetical protein Pan153_42990 [Gimesia panareensis]
MVTAMTVSWRKAVRELLMTAGILFVCYVGIYIILSSMGTYYFNQSGEVRYRSMGLAVSDISTWNPEGCRFQYQFKNIKGKYVSRGNDLGYLFAPLIMLDRRFVHPTQVLIEPEVPGETYWFPL